ncbi:MAG TPA: sulfotransferase [Gaiellaceae bacterium]|nr:sulfotransferase [Gaiellaceae bacterium]
MGAGGTVFVVGAARSGTTFVQTLLGAHPGVVTAQENDLFDQFVAPWRAAWEYQLPADAETWRRRRHKGLPAVLREEEFDALLAGAIERVHAATRALKPEASVLVDKTPGNVLHAELILRFLPDARFVHVVRDGRDVVCSLRRAGRGWGAEWASQALVDNARAWRARVEAGHGIASLADAYREVRFERLAAGEGAAEELGRLFAFCGVEATAAECARILAEHELGAEARSSLVWGGEVVARLGGPPEEPEGFAGEGGVGAWRRELGARERLVVERYAGDLLRELGYAGDDWPGVAPLARGVALGRLALERARLRTGRALRGALQQ